MNRPGFTLWFTGLPASGKTTLAALVERALRDRGLKVELLDGDEVRAALSPSLGFSKADRDTHIRRVGYLCKLLSRNGVVAIVAAISPYREIREEVRKAVGAFVEVYVCCPVEVCRRRDGKGLYERAFRGEITNFTGVSDPYEEPLSPEIVVENDRATPEESAAHILDALTGLGYLAPAFGLEQKS